MAGSGIAGPCARGAGMAILKALGAEANGKTIHRGSCNDEGNPQSRRLLKGRTQGPRDWPQAMLSAADAHSPGAFAMVNP